MRTSTMRRQIFTDWLTYVRNLLPNNLGPSRWVFLLIITTASLNAEPAVNWNQFRGPNGDGISTATDLPVEFDESRLVRWKTAIQDSGWSSPVLWGNQIWLTTGSNKKKELRAICVDVKNGQITKNIKVFDMIKRTVDPAYKYDSPHLNSPATPTPVVEESCVFVSFGSQGIACLDRKTGDKLWERRDLQIYQPVRQGSSPIVDKDFLYLAYDGTDQQFFVALDKNTGKTHWKTDRDVRTDWDATLRAKGFPSGKGGKPNDNKKSFATATIIEVSGQRQLIAPAAEATIAYEPDTGKELWRVLHPGGFNVAARPVHANGLVYVFTSGLTGYLMAIKPDGNGDVTDTHVVWSTTRSTPNIPSPVIVDDLLFMVTDKGGIARCLDAQTGEEFWKVRLGGDHWASPIYGNGKLYFSSKHGEVTVLKASRKSHNIIARNEMDASFIASPAIVDSSLILRSTTHLYCIDTGQVPVSRERTETRQSNFAKDKQPNVVTLLVDDLGYRDIGCYGGPAKTPVLDKLAAGGVRFTDFHSGAPVCSPSRATFLTGRNHIRAGVYSVLSEQRHRMHLLRSETTLAEVLKDEGYVTAHFGKWHLGMPVNNRDNPTPAEHGFDYWFGLVNGAHPSHKDPTNFLRNGKPVGPMRGYSCQLVVDEAIDWLDKKRGADAPFFINLWFNEPHAVIAAPDEIVSRYGALNDQAAIYNGTIDNTDRAIGRLVAKLEQLGELDNTIIHYSSDNGSYRQERSGELRGKKGSHHEGGHRVPGIFYWKEQIPSGRVEKEPAGAVDLLPTICGLLGIDKPKDVFLDGSDLTPLLTRTGSFERHQPLFWMNGSTMVLRMGDHTLLAPSTARLPFDNAKANRLLQQTKLALGDDLEKELGGLDLRSRMFNGQFANPEANRLRDEFRAMFYFNEALIPLMKKGGVDRVQLYDLANDLSQERDIAAEKPEIVAWMKKRANAIYQSVMADAPEWNTPEELAAAKKPQENTPDRPAPAASDTAKLLARIDKTPLPKGYDGSHHQPYVDRVMATLKPEQRARVGQLWKEKRRLDPVMPNPGASFVKILTHVAEDAGTSKQKLNK